MRRPSHIGRLWMMRHNGEGAGHRGSLYMSEEPSWKWILLLQTCVLWVGDERRQALPMFMTQRFVSKCKWLLLAPDFCGRVL